jgi:hypothetical protein
MTNSHKRHILLFSHRSQVSIANWLQSETEQLKPESFDISVKLLDDSSNFQNEDLDKFGGYIILYSPQLAKNENLYRVIKHFEDQGDFQRFLILPQKEAETIPLPPIFHTIRSQQHHIYGYDHNPVLEDRDAPPFKDIFIKDFSDHLWQMGKSEKVEKAKEPKTVWSKVRDFIRSKRGKTLLLMTPVFIALLLAITYLVPILFENMRSNQVVFDDTMSPPDFNTFWINEDFSTADDLEIWEITNRYKGKNHLLATRLSHEFLEIYANEEIFEAEYKFESLKHWSLEKLNGFQSTFQIQTTQNVNTDVSLAYKLNLVDDDRYSIGCIIQPSLNEGSLECYISDLEAEQRFAIPYPGVLDLDEWHTLVIEFNPRSYALRFFIDDAFFGQAAIPSAEEWKSKEFDAIVQVTINDLQTFPYSIKINQIQLAHQE